MKSILTKIVPAAMVVLAIVVLVYGFIAGSKSGRQPAPTPVAAGAASTIQRADVAPITEADWSVFRISGQKSSVTNGHFRLAGTFFVMGNAEGDAERPRMAIIDDIAANQQTIVSEGQTYQNYEILRIYDDRLIMRRDGVEVELTLSFQDTSSSGPDIAQKQDDAGTNTISGEVVLESNRFGKRIGEKRWVIQKDAIHQYYQELLDNPDRIAAIYMSMKPDYSDDGAVAGYTLNAEGEKDFFSAVGLQEGDTIRKVNSMRMTSQKRAEYFIGEFMQERLGAVVLDIERNGQPEKFVYFFR